MLEAGCLASRTGEISSGIFALMSFAIFYLFRGAYFWWISDLPMEFNHGWIGAVKRMEDSFLSHSMQS